MAIKGIKKTVRIQYNRVKCSVCQKTVIDKYCLNGVTYEPIGVCQDCRSEQYDCAPNLVWEYEKKHNITGIIEVEGLDDEEQVTPEGEDENGVENPEIEIAPEPMTNERASAILSQARKGEVTVGNASISYDKSTRRYSVLLPKNTPRSFSVRQAREFLVTTL